MEYHKIATGNALVTVNAHSGSHEFKFYGACFCPFVQRAWIHLECAGIDYQYIEIDPYAKPDELIAINPKGLVPSLRHGDWGCFESTVIMEYIEDLKPTLLRGTAQERADARRWAHYINSNIVPAFYRLLQKNEDELTRHIQYFKTHIKGPFFMGEWGYVDVMIAPWIVRFETVLLKYRSWQHDMEEYVAAVCNHEQVKATTSSDELYYESYARYAENRPGTSQVANAINEGRGLP